MSTYKVLKAVSERLRGLLWEAYRADSQFVSLVTSENDIVFTNPTETVRNTAHRLSLWLYQVTENEYLKNQPTTRGNGHTSVQETPLALNLFYLVTPVAPTEEYNLLMLGSAMQVFYDNAIIPLQDDPEAVYEELRVILCRLSLEELTRIWEALREPYRLSVCYQVRVTRIASRRTPQTARVSQADHDYGSVPDEARE